MVLAITERINPAAPTGIRNVDGSLKLKLALGGARGIQFLTQVVMQLAILPGSGAPTHTHASPSACCCLSVFSREACVMDTIAQHLQQLSHTRPTHPHACIAFCMSLPVLFSRKARVMDTITMWCLVPRMQY
jgi:hypothetical protein